MFYTALGRLLMVELGENEGRFAHFMTPITSELTRDVATLKPVYIYDFLFFLSADTLEQVKTALSGQTVLSEQQIKVCTRFMINLY